MPMAAVFFVGEPDDFAGRSRRVRLQRLDVLGWCLKILLEKLFENVQGHGFHPMRINGLLGSTVF